jgi:hypothetical protein
MQTAGEEEKKHVERAGNVSRYRAIELKKVDKDHGTECF